MRKFIRWPNGHPSERSISEAPTIDTKKIAEIYMLVRSECVPKAVADWCTDMTIAPDYEAFKLACWRVARIAGLMKPTFLEVRTAYEGLVPGGKA